MSNNIYSDDFILSLKKVTVQIAAEYLGISVRNIQAGMQEKMFPFGIALKKKEWIYIIFPERLVMYKHGYDMIPSALAS